MGAITDKEHRRSAGALRDALATYKKNEDLILLGAYKSGADKRVDNAIEKISIINSFLKQAVDDQSNFASSVEGLKNMFPPSEN